MMSLSKKLVVDLICKLRINSVVLLRGVSRNLSLVKARVELQPVQVKPNFIVTGYWLREMVLFRRIIANRKQSSTVCTTALEHYLYLCIGVIVVICMDMIVVVYHERFLLLQIALALLKSNMARLSHFVLPSAHLWKMA